MDASSNSKVWCICCYCQSVLCHLFSFFGLPSAFLLLVWKTRFSFLAENHVFHFRVACSCSFMVISFRQCCQIISETSAIRNYLHCIFVQCHLLQYHFRRCHRAYVHITSLIISTLGSINFWFVGCTSSSLFRSIAFPVCAPWLALLLGFYRHCLADWLCVVFSPALFRVE